MRVYLLERVAEHDFTAVFGIFSTPEAAMEFGSKAAETFYNQGQQGLGYGSHLPVVWGKPFREKGLMQWNGPITSNSEYFELTEHEVDCPILCNARTWGQD